MPKISLLALLVLLTAACGDRPEPAPEPAAAAQPAGDWIVLFDGTSLDGFRGYKRDDVPDSWTIQDGALQFAVTDDRGNLITRDQFGDFELELEWKISEAGNSGIIYRATEEHGEPWMTGVEYQILDNLAHPDARFGPDRMAGAAYDLYPTDSLAVAAVGEWNSTRILARGEHVEHWLNGRMVVEYDIGSDEWNARFADSKWPDWPSLGTTRTGHIALQDHSDPVWFRSIRIRRL